MSKTQSDNAKRQRPAGSTKFVEIAKSEPAPTDLEATRAVEIDEESDDSNDTENDEWYGEKFNGTIDEDTVRRYTLGDCYLLATELAEQNNWGMVVVASVSEDEDIDDCWDVENLVHAYAQRPDGKLVDVNGVTPMDTAKGLASQWKQHGVKIHSFTTAAAAHAMFDKDTWGDEADYEDAGVVAQMVTDLQG